MNRADLKELHYITPIANIASILKLGILSHRRAAKMRPASVAKQEVQDLRARVHVPNGRALHEYANLYICARNPMLYKRLDMHEELCVLSVRPSVLDLPNVVITDQNAASGYARFLSSPNGLLSIDAKLVFADDWRHPGDYRHRSVKCAEVLVPDSVDPAYIMGAYVSNAETLRSLAEQAPGLQVAIHAHLFFR